MICKSKIILGILLLLALMAACRHGLKPVVYRVMNNERRSLGTEDTYYLSRFEMTDRKAANPIQPGRGNVLVTNQSYVNPDAEELNTGLILAVSEINYRIYISLPDQIQAESLDIASRSICRIIGLYDLPDSLRHYECIEGFLKIDTVKSSRFHARVAGIYLNPVNDTLSFDGDLNASRRN
nr:hypothetical protein [candidate division Zixibacteria bacterium]